MAHNKQSQQNESTRNRNAGSPGDDRLGSIESRAAARSLMIS